MFVIHVKPGFNATTGFVSTISGKNGEYLWSNLYITRAIKFKSKEEAQSAIDNFSIGCKVDYKNMLEIQSV